MHEDYKATAYSSLTEFIKGNVLDNNLGYSVFPEVIPSLLLTATSFTDFDFQRTSTVLLHFYRTSTEIQILVSMLLEKLDSTEWEINPSSTEQKYKSILLYVISYQNQIAKLSIHKALLAYPSTLIFLDSQSLRK